jgi:hypothetical protein
MWFRKNPRPRSVEHNMMRVVVEPSEFAWTDIERLMRYPCGEISLVQLLDRVK